MEPTRTPLITGWLKKEADKGLKVGNFIKKPFNDRWFVLDNVDRRLYYYEKKNSEVPNGFLDLAKVSRLEKTGRNDTEFLVEIVDDVLGAKVYTLQAPSAAQMELWIKALNIVKESARPKTKAPPAASSPTSPSPAPIFGSALNPATSSIDSGAKSPSSLTLAPTDVISQPQSSNSEPSATNKDSPANSTPHARSAAISSSSFKASTSIDAPRSGPGGKFLGAQRSSMHPSTKPELHPSSVAARVANLEPTNKLPSKERWSVAKVPSSGSDNWYPPSSDSSPSSGLPTPAIATLSTSKQTPDYSTPPGNVELETELSSSPSHGDESAQSGLGAESLPPTPSEAVPATSSAQITGVFKVGETLVTLSSSLSSLAPQQSGSLLSHGDTIEGMAPLVRNYNEGVKLQLSPGSGRSPPVVPSPLSILEEGLRRSYVSDPPITSETCYSSQDALASDNVLEASSPEEFSRYLRMSRHQPSQEVCIRLNNWRLIGMNGSWAAKLNTGSDSDAASVDLHESTLTWHLPGFLVVQWISFDKWQVFQREISPSDEIKWDLVSIGKRLSTMDSFVSIPRQAVLYHLYAVVSRIMMHTNAIVSAFETPLEQQAETISQDETFQNLVRVDLCTRIAAVMFDGFNDWSLLRTFHIWDFIFDAAVERSGLKAIPSIDMPLVVRDLARLHPDCNIRFRNFVISALNSRQLFVWMSELISNRPEVEDYYDELSWVRQAPTLVLAALAPLSNLPLELPLEGS